MVDYETIEGRLSLYVKPKNYKLNLEPNLNDFTFSGTLKIELKMERPAARLELYSKDLDIKEVRAQYESREVSAGFKVEKEADKLMINLTEAIAGDVTVFIKYNGKIRDDLNSFYRSKYKGRDGSDKYLATTQFEAPYARGAFPCIDEPGWKATFDISMKIDKNLTTISNMPIKKETEEGDKKIIEFEQTPKMSTYILYFAVGDFEFLEDEYEGIKLRIATIPGKKEQGEFALEVTKKALKYFTEFSGIPYPLKKLDHIAIPDFQAGAMENWGAIAYREIVLLLDPKVTSTKAKKRIAEVIAHEIWHQWSGNLVTMKWWDDLWLNESFATYMAYKAIDDAYPEWKIWEEFSFVEGIQSFYVDSLNTTHPIEADVKDTSEIEELFDGISYAKGGLILRMLESYLGPEVFRKGVSKYLHKYSYKNAQASNFWNTLAEVSDKPIKRVMEGWIKTAGHPIIESNLSENTLMIKQKRARFGEDEDQPIWPIPLVITLADLEGNSETFVELFNRKSMHLKLNGRIGWYKINPDHLGFYRVRYADDNLAKLSKLVEDKTLSVLDRLGIQDDVYSAILNGDGKLEEFLYLLESYKDEDNYQILRSMHNSLVSIKYVFSSTEEWNSISNKFNSKFNEPYKNALARLGWDSIGEENQEDTLMRSLSIAHLSFVKDPEVIEEGKRRYQIFVKDRESLHPDLRDVVLAIAARNGNRDTYEQMLKLYLESEIVEEKRALLITLGEYRDKEILKDFLKIILTDKVKLQEWPASMFSVASNPEARDVLYDWIEENWDEIKKKEDSHFIFLNVIDSLVSSSIGEEREQRVLKFLKSHPIKYEKKLMEFLAKLRRKNEWLKNNKESIVKYFS